jgi:hypothetical protein
VRAIFDEVAERFSDGCRHILGDELTVADIGLRRDGFAGDPAE